MVKITEEYYQNCICVFLSILLFVSPLTVGAGQTAMRTGREKLRTRVKVSVVDTPIETVLMDLANQADIDIIKSPDVNDNVTVTVTDVPLEEALTNILAVHDYTYIATENMIRVIKLPETVLMKEPQVTRIYKITQANVDEISAVLEEFTSKKAEIGLNRGTGHIVVTDTEDKIRAIDKLIEQIDRITSQVLVEVRIYDVTTKEGFELNTDWHIGRNAPYIPGTIKEKTETIIGEEVENYEQKRTEMRWEAQSANEYPDPNFVGVKGTAETITPIYEQIDNITTTDAARKDTETRYIDYSGIADWRRKPFVGGSFDRVTGGTLHFSVLNDAIDLDFVLTILHSQIEARLLANPRVLVLDNETANFRIMREIPYREFRQVGREDPIEYTAFKDVGVNLKVTPHIARDGMLRLHIVPEFSVLVNQDKNGVPTVDARRADTKAMIKDGQTIVLGGLRKREISKGVSKVPVLCDMPLVGGLFTSEYESEAINELIVFITTTIITQPTLSESEQKLLSETKFTTPVLEKTRIEKGEFDKTKDEESDIKDSLDLLLEKLEPSRN